MRPHELSIVAMSRTGHRAVREWLYQQTGKHPRNIEAQSWVKSMEMCKANGTAPILLLRDYPNWLASIVSYMRHDSIEPFHLMVDNWISHVEQAYTVPTILFNEWVKAGHGDGIVISKGGDATRFDGGSVLTRYEQMADDPRYVELMQREDAVGLSHTLFENRVGVAA